MIIPLLTTVLYVGKTIVIRNAQIYKNTPKNKNCEWEMFLFFICPQLVQTGQLLDSQCYSLSLEQPDFNESTRLPLWELLNSCVVVGSGQFFIKPEGPARRER